MTLATKQPNKKACRNSNTQVYLLQCLMTLESPIQSVWLSKAFLKAFMINTKEKSSLVSPLVICMKMCMQCKHILLFKYAHMHRKPLLGCKHNNLLTTFLLQSQPFGGYQNHNYLLHASKSTIPITVNFQTITEYSFCSTPPS